MEQQKPFPIPVNYFSIVLGLSALGLALWHAYCRAAFDC